MRIESIPKANHSILFAVPLVQLVESVVFDIFFGRIVKVRSLISLKELSEASEIFTKPF